MGGEFTGKQTCQRITAPLAGIDVTNRQACLSAFACTDS
jgi:hypothetical protein